MGCIIAHDLNSLNRGRRGCNLKSIIFKIISGHISWAFSVKSPQGKCPKTSLMIIEHGSGNGLCLQTTSQHLSQCWFRSMSSYGVPDSKVHRANMGPIWGRQDPDGPHVGPIGSLGHNGQLNSMHDVEFMANINDKTIRQRKNPWSLYKNIVYLVSLHWKINVFATKTYTWNFSFTYPTIANAYKAILGTFSFITRTYWQWYCRHEPLNEAHDCTFGILENCHC